MMVKENDEGYTKKQSDGAIKACHLQGMIGHPSQCEFKTLVHEQMIQSCPVNPNDVTITHNLYFYLILKD